MILHTLPTFIIATTLFSVAVASLAYCQNIMISRYETIPHTSLLVNHLQDSNSKKPSIHLYNMGIENLKFPEKAFNFFFTSGQPWSSRSSI